MIQDDWIVVCNLHKSVDLISYNLRCFIYRENSSEISIEYIKKIS